MSLDKPLPDLEYGLLHKLAGHLLRHAFNRGQAAFYSQFQQHGLTPLQYMMIELVCQNPGVVHLQICQAMETAPSVVTTAMKPLIERNLIDRARGNRDRRQLDYRLTENGRQWFLRIREEIWDCEDQLLKNLNPQQRKQLRSLLLKTTGI